MIDSLTQAVRIVNDSLNVVVGGPPIRVPPAQVVFAPDRGPWSSPILQTLLGGALALVGGVGTELFRKWRGDHSKRVKLTKTIETPLRELCRLLGEWSRLHRRPEGVRLPYAQDCMRLWTYGERTRPLWTELEDNALEREVEDWYAETLEAIKLSITYLAGMPDVSDAGKREVIHDWQSMESDMSSFAYEGLVLADRIWQLRRLAITRWWSAHVPRFLGGVLKSRPSGEPAGQ